MPSTTMGSKYICKFCMKRFPCGRSLGGHIRSHLIHNNNNSSNSPSDQQSKLSKPGYELRENPKKTNKDTKLLNSSRSSCSNGSESGSILINKDKNIGRRSLSEVVEPEQEEVAIAMCLIKLSRGVGKWGDFSSCEFCDDIVLLQPKETQKSTTKTEKKQGKCSVFGANNGVDVIYKKSKNMEFLGCGSLQNGSKMKTNVEVPTNGFASDDQSNKVSDRKTKDVGNVPSWNIQCGLKMKENEVFPNELKLNNQCNKPPLSKRKVEDEITTHGSGKNWSKMVQFQVCEDKLVLNDQTTNIINKRSKFECTTCNKVFHSYQALGGHRASHKRLLCVKNSIFSKLDESANDLPTHPSPSNHQEQEQIIGDNKIGSSTLSSKKMVQKHECPFCFRIFPSGQALGGHKRSHDQINLIERSTSFEIRDLLDLNLPPLPSEEDTTTITSSNSQDELIKPHWWVESSKHEPILSLISN